MGGSIGGRVRGELLGRGTAIVRQDENLNVSTDVAVTISSGGLIQYGTTRLYVSYGTWRNPFTNFTASF